MHHIFAFAAFVGIAVSAPSPQLINVAAIEAAPDPVLYTPPLDVESNVPTPAATAPLTPITTPGSKRDTIGVEKRDGTCAQQPVGGGPVPAPDTASTFSQDDDLQVRMRTDLCFLCLCRCTR